MSYPTSIYAGTSVAGTTSVSDVDHAANHNGANSELTAIETVLGTTAGTSVLKNFVAGNFAARINSSNVLQQPISGTATITVGTISNVLVGTSQITGGTIATAVVNNATVGTPSVTGGTISSAVVNNPTVGQDWNGYVTASDTWVYASASTFTISGVDRTAIFTTGTKLKFTNSGTKYAVVASSSFSTNTTVTIIVNTDYTIANAAISAPQYSYMEHPADFPSGFNYTPTGIASSNVTLTGRYSIIGRRCFVKFKCVFAGAITFTTMPTLPIAASASIVGSAFNPSGVGGYLDSGTINALMTVSPVVIASATTVNVVRSSDTVTMSASVPITWANNDILDLDFDYEI